MGIRGVDQGGVCNVKRLRDRCRIDDETGCWRMAAEQVWVRMPDGTYRTMRRRRAALFVATGERLPKSTIAFQAPHCAHEDCARPDHAAAGDWSAFMRANSALGKLDTPVRRANAAKNLDRSKLTPEQRAEIRNSLENGRVLAERYGISRSLVNAIRSANGASHYRPRVRAASVFEWRPE
jgi:hypothetical protein